MRSVLSPAVEEARDLSLRSYDFAALVLLAAFSLIWPSYASPQFWTDPNAQRDILGVNSIAYYTAIMNDINVIAFERRPLFGYVVWPLKWVYDVLFGLDDGDAALAAFRTVGMLPPLLVYSLARLRLPILPSFAIGGFSAGTLVVMFNHVAFDSYALTMVAGLAGLIIATIFYRLVADPVGQHPYLAGIGAIVVTAAAGWVGLTLLSLLLVFLIPAVAKAARPWQASIWAGVVAGGSGILYIVPSLITPGVSQVQGAMATRYLMPENLVSGEAWANRLTSDLIASFAYPGSALSGSRYPGIIDVENWMGPVREAAMSNLWAIALGVFALALMAMSWKAVLRHDTQAYVLLAIWLALAASVIFFVMWDTGEAMLFAGCVWPYQMALLIAGRAQIGPRPAWAVDFALLVCAALMFANNLGVLNATAGIYD